MEAGPEEQTRGAAEGAGEHVRAGRPHTSLPPRPSPADLLLSRLERVRDCGHGRWMARCPSHTDRSPSLSVRSCEDGALLIHCFAGCGAADVLAAVGLELRDLYPSPLAGSGPRRDRDHRHAARDALRIISREALLVEIVAEDLARGAAKLTEDNRELLTRCASRIRAAREVAG